MKLTNGQSFWKRHFSADEFGEKYGSMFAMLDLTEDVLIKLSEYKKYTGNVCMY